MAYRLSPRARRLSASAMPSARRSESYQLYFSFVTPEPFYVFHYLVFCVKDSPSYIEAFQLSFLSQTPQCSSADPQELTSLLYSQYLHLYFLSSCPLQGGRIHLFNKEATKKKNNHQWSWPPYTGHDILFCDIIISKGDF